MDACTRISVMISLVSMVVGIGSGVVFALFVSALLARDERQRKENDDIQGELIDRDLYESMKET